MDYYNYSLRLEDIIDKIKKGGMPSPKELARKYACSERTVRRMINLLRSKGNEIKYCRKTNKYLINWNEDKKCPPNRPDLY